MDKDIENSKKGDDYRINIEIPESIKKNLPDDFRIDDIGKIDLREAETIANEDIVFLSENDLIEGLEDFDLIPLKEKKKPEVKVKEPEHQLREKEEPEITPSATQDDEKKWVPLGKEPDLDQEEGWTPLERVEEEMEGNNWVPLEKVMRDTEEASTDKREPFIEEKPQPERAGTEIQDSEKASIKEPEAEPLEREGEPEDYHKDMEELDWVPLSADEAEGQALTDETIAAYDATDYVTEKETVDDKLAQKEKILPETAQEKPPVFDETPVLDTVPVQEIAVDEPGIAAFEPERDVKAEVVKDIPVKEEGPESFLMPKSEPPGAEQDDDQAGSGEVIFINDDLGSAGTGESERIFDESDLEKLTSDIMAYDEGRAYIMHEANIDEDREKIARIADGLVQGYDELLYVDDEYRYRDDELDFIHTAVMEEDYGRYIQEIDEFFGPRGSRQVSTATELLGLTVDEIDTIEDSLFMSEYQDVDLHEMVDVFDREREETSLISVRGDYTYMLPSEDSLLDFEKESIESDISSGSALIYEEDVEKIRSQLRDRLGEAAVEKVEVVDTIYDITDQIVILDDKDDIQRFIEEFPQERQVDIKMLLNYLDGLFERLPEEVIKKFADSEYFDLYLKVLNELGV